MLRSAAFVLSLALAAPAAAQVTGALAPATPALKAKVTIAGEIVRIGDLVENAGPAAQIAVFRSPDLGTTGIVPAERVLEAIRAHAVIGVDTRGAVEIAVTRASRAITRADIERRIKQALAGKNGFGAAASILLAFDRDIRTLHVEPDATGELHIARWRYDPRTTRFDMEFELPGSAAARRGLLRFTGTAVETVEVATVARTIARGEILKASDIAIERKPKADVTGNTIATTDTTVGLAARRQLRAGQMLREGDLMRPELVQRNESVTLVYEVPGVLLTMRGKALESGSNGDTVNVLNVQSKRTVQGIVTGHGRVDVTSAMSPGGTNFVALPAPVRPGSSKPGVE